MDHKECSTPVVQIVGYKNSGKTTAVCELLRRFSSAGITTGTVKHDAHGFEPDIPGTDSWRHRQAGASVSAITSADKTAVFESRPAELSELIRRIQGVDVILVEGFKTEPYPKWVLLRTEADLELLEHIRYPIGISSAFPLRHPSLPVISRDDYDAMFELTMLHLREGRQLPENG